MEQIKCYCGHTTRCDCGPLDEPVIEEAAANLADPNVCKTDNWIAGAKWMQEQQTNRERFLELVSDEETDTVEQAKQRIEKRKATRTMTTPVEWLQEQYNQCPTWEEHITEEEFEQAKEMENEQKFDFANKYAEAVMGGCLLNAENFYHLYFKRQE
jgi:hypothetical protein